MTYSQYSSKAPTGYLTSGAYPVSSNPYSPAGRTTSYPSKMSTYAQKLDASEGSQAVVETRYLSEILGARLYLNHRPLLNSNSTITTITVSNGTINPTLTNYKQGYIVFSTLPTQSSFTVSYTAAPDSFSMWHLNAIQDDIQTIQSVLGPTSVSTYPGLRNLDYGIFNSPQDSVVNGVAQNAVYLSHLNRNITIGSTEDPTLTGSLGIRHTIKIGRNTDSVHLDATGIKFNSSSSLNNTVIQLGNKTGDSIFFLGNMSGAGQVTFGGPERPDIHSGTIPPGILAAYTGAVVRIRGDLVYLGNISGVGAITVVNATGETSTVIGDFTVTSKLTVLGNSTLVGPVTTNILNIQNKAYLYGDLIANNTVGSGGDGQSLLDNLDASEVAHTYKTVMQKKGIPNSIISAPLRVRNVIPVTGVNTAYQYVDTRTGLVGDQWMVTGLVLANAGPSGAHPSIIQLRTNIPIITGTYTGTVGGFGGSWSKGLMDPGTTWIKIYEGTAAGYTAPIYGYTVEGIQGNSVTGLNVFTPKLNSPNIQTNDKFVLYNPYAVPYQYIDVTPGLNPTFVVSGNTTEPLRIAFEEEVRILKARSPSYELGTALYNSISGLTNATVTGSAYIFASMVGTDIEAAPVFIARPSPVRMPGETVIGEVIATASSPAYNSWTTLDVVSYRPGTKYDSAWLPIITDKIITGRAISMTGNGRTKLYFNHHLGGDADMFSLATDLYLARMTSGNPRETWNQHHSPLFSIAGGDRRNHIVGMSGDFTKIPLTNTMYGNSVTSARDASVFYLDSRLVGIEVSNNTIESMTNGGSAFNYARLVIRRDS